MTKQHVHYEAAFEDYVRSRGWPYIPVNEQRKAIFAGARVKSFDFVVYVPGEKAWLVDVKGRKFPYECKGGKHYWENWVTEEDLEGLQQWSHVLGDEYEPMLMFVYWLLGPPEHDPAADIHVFRNEYYAFLPVTVRAYAAAAKQRSTKWGTVSVSLQTFRNIAQKLPPTPADPVRTP